MFFVMDQDAAGELDAGAGASTTADAESQFKNVRVYEQ